MKRELPASTTIAGAPTAPWRRASPPLGIARPAWACQAAAWSAERFATCTTRDALEAVRSCRTSTSCSQLRGCRAEKLFAAIARSAPL
jgi:hypothetical protein